MKDKSLEIQKYEGRVMKLHNYEKKSIKRESKSIVSSFILHNSYVTPDTHQFTGKEMDSEMGLNYFCQRYYDPQIGRFMTLDPFGGYIELPQSQNRYAYVMNNPLKYIDPLGLCYYDAEANVWRGEGWDPLLELYQFEEMEVIGERYQGGEPTGLPLKDNSDINWQKIVASRMRGGSKEIGRLLRDKTVGGGALTIARMNAGENYLDVAGIEDAPQAGSEGSAAQISPTSFVLNPYLYMAYIMYENDVAVGAEWGTEMIPGAGFATGQNLVSGPGITGDYLFLGTGTGFSLGSSASAVFALGAGSWAGTTRHYYGLTVGSYSVSIFTSGNWAGLSIGKGIGIPFGLTNQTRTYVRWLRN